MCLVLYLGTNVPLETTEWDEETSTFFVGMPTSEEMQVQRHFDQPLVYYIGSKTQCGCGFDYGTDWRSDEEEAESDDREQREHLATLLGQIMDVGGEAEVLACWSGDERFKPTHELAASPEQFVDRRVLDEGYHVRVNHAKS